MTWRLLIATQELALFDEEDRQMLDNADVLSWHCYTDLVQCNFANLRGVLRGPSLFSDFFYCPTSKVGAENGEHKKFK